MNRILSGLLGAAAVLALAGGAWPARADYVHPAPGYYRIRALESGRCAGVAEGSGFQASHLVLRSCDDNARPFYNYVAVIPVRGYDRLYTIRPYSFSQLSSAAVRTRLEYCVTRARGVVAGAPRADLQPCGFHGRSVSWCEAGAADQLFSFFLVASGPPPSYRISFYGTPGASPVWDVRDHGRNLGDDILLFAVTGGANQLFELMFDRPLDTPDDIACLPLAPASPVSP